MNFMVCPRPLVKTFALPVELYPSIANMSIDPIRRVCPRARDTGYWEEEGGEEGERDGHRDKQTDRDNRKITRN